MVQTSGFYKQVSVEEQSDSVSPQGSSKFSTVNHICKCNSGTNLTRQCRKFGPSSATIHSFGSRCHQPSKSYWEKNVASSCLVGFMRFIQHQCNPKRRSDLYYNQPVTIIHNDLAHNLRQLKCDLDKIIDMDKMCDHVDVTRKNEDSPRKILTRMACKIYEIEDRINSPNALTCGELMTKRKIMLKLIKTVQKTVCNYLHCEEEGLKDKRARLCNFLKYLQCMEHEFRCMTRGIKLQCCKQICDKHTSVEKYNLALTPVRASTPSPQMQLCTQCTQTCDSVGKKNKYEVTGVDVVYTKTTIHTYESNNPDENCVERTQEECVDKKVVCDIPKCGEPVCEVKIRNGAETVDLCNSEPLKQVLCQFSGAWQESAKELIEAFKSC